MSQSINLLLLFPDEINSQPIPPGTKYWINSDDEKFTDSNDVKFIFQSS